MAEVTLEFLAEQLVRVLNGQHLIREEIAEMKHRLQAVETGIVDLRRDVVNLHADTVRLGHRMDRIEERVARIERRLDLVDS